MHSVREGSGGDFLRKEYNWITREIKRQAKKTGKDGSVNNVKKRKDVTRGTKCEDFIRRLKKLEGKLN